MNKLGHVSIDGTEVKANASDAKTYDNVPFRGWQGKTISAKVTETQNKKKAKATLPCQSN